MLLPHWFCDTDTPSLLQAILLLPPKVAHTSPHWTVTAERTVLGDTLTHAYNLPLFYSQHFSLLLLFVLTLFIYIFFHPLRSFPSHTTNPAGPPPPPPLSIHRCGRVSPCHLDLPLCRGSSQVSIKVCWVWLLHFPSLCQVCQQQLLSPPGGHCFQTAGRGQCANQKKKGKKNIHQVRCIRRKDTRQIDLEAPRHRVI